MTNAKAFPTDQCFYQSSDALGDGFCNDELNTIECNFDDGDCCLSTVLTNVCKECKCHQKSVVNKRKEQCGIIKEEALKIVDKCHDDLNVPECDYSNKQCCGKADLNFCHECACKDPRNTERRGNTCLQ